MKTFLVEITAYDPALATTRTLRFATHGYNEYPTGWAPAELVYFEEYSSGLLRLTTDVSAANAYPKSALGNITIDDDPTGADQLFAVGANITIVEA